MSCSETMLLYYLDILCIAPNFLIYGRPLRILLLFFSEGKLLSKLSNSQKPINQVKTLGAIAWSGALFLIESRTTPHISLKTTAIILSISSSGCTCVCEFPYPFSLYTNSSEMSLPKFSVTLTFSTQQSSISLLFSYFIPKGKNWSPEYLHQDRGRIFLPLFPSRISTNSIPI